MIDQELFHNLHHEYMTGLRTAGGIGTLSEKTIHAVLKDCMDSNPDHQEQPFGQYIADIYDGSAVVEIQTRSFDRLRGKLSCFLEKVPVTIVHPVAATKYITVIDPDTGEIISRRKSPKKGRPCDVMKELYRIKMFLDDPNLFIHLIFIDVDEYREKYTGPKRGRYNKKNPTTRIEQIPIRIADEITLDSPGDYLKFIPDGLPGIFSSKDLAKAAHVTVSTAQTTLNILFHVGVIDKVGKEKNLILYRIKEM